MIKLKEEKITRIRGVLSLLEKVAILFRVSLMYVKEERKHQVPLNSTFSCQKWYRGLLILGFTSCGIGYLMLGPAPFLTFFPQRFVTTLR